MRTQSSSILGRIERAARALESAFIVVFLGTLVLLASAQIVLRNVFSTSLPWGDELVRLLVLWLALVGAIAASRDARQIRIDVVSRALPEGWVWLPECLSGAFTAVVCAILAWQSARFVLDSRAFGDVLLGDMPAWWFQIILPVGFAIMAFRYFLRALHHAIERA